MNLSDYIMGYLLALSIGVVSVISVLPFLLATSSSSIFIIMSCLSVLLMTLHIFWSDTESITKSLYQLKLNILVCTSNLITGQSNYLVSIDLMHSIFIIIGCINATIPDISTYLELCATLPGLQSFLPYPVMLCLIILSTVTLVGTYLQDISTINQHIRKAIHENHMTYILGQTTIFFIIIGIQHQLAQSKLIFTISAFISVSLLCGIDQTVKYFITSNIIQSIISSFASVKSFRANAIYLTFTQSIKVISSLYLGFCDILFYSRQVSQQINPTQVKNTPLNTPYTIMNMLSTYAKSGFSYSKNKPVNTSKLMNMVIGFLSSQQSIQTTMDPPTEKPKTTPETGRIYIFSLNVLFLFLTSTWVSQTNPMLFNKMATWLHRSDILSIPNHISSAVAFVGLHLPISNSLSTEVKPYPDQPGHHQVSSQ